VPYRSAQAVHTQATPIAQPTSHDDPLPEIPRDIAGFPDDKSAQ
jgi:hypothetical protein